NIGRSHLYLTLSVYHHVVLLALHSFPTRRSSDLAHGQVIGCGELNVTARLDTLLKLNRPTGHYPDMTSGVDVLAGDVTPDDKGQDRKSTRLNSSHVKISYAVFCLKKKN